MFTRILVSLDGSALAEAVLPVVERLATAFGATLVLVHVPERGAPATVHGEPHLTDPAAAAAYLDGAAEQLRARGIAVETHVREAREGDVAASIADHGANEQADLIVLCTHGRGGLRGFLWGSIAQQVLQRGTTPVLLVGRPRPARPRRRSRRARSWSHSTRLPRPRPRSRRPRRSPAHSARGCTSRWSWRRPVLSATSGRRPPCCCRRRRGRS